LGNIEKLLDPFLPDFQKKTLQKALARLPKRQATYEARIDRDDALGELDTAVNSSDLSLREQITYFKKLKASFIKENRIQNEGQKNVQRRG
jgi:hypothetical protein